MLCALLIFGTVVAAVVAWELLFDDDDWGGR